MLLLISLELADSGDFNMAVRVEIGIRLPVESAQVIEVLGR